GGSQPPVVAKLLTALPVKAHFFLRMPCSGSRIGRRVTFRHEPGELVMPSQTIRPSTMEGIQRLAKSLRGELSIKHLQALDAAAQAAGFQNFRHARNQLRAVPKIERFH